MGDVDIFSKEFTAYNKCKNFTSIHLLFTLFSS